MRARILIQFLLVYIGQVVPLLPPKFDHLAKIAPSNVEAYQEVIKSVESSVGLLTKLSHKNALPILEGT